ncbi:hypothetical protein FQA39_LY15929 [Lamprigera yunnana]|nr:hypothetical protein FQA39_LY15929 [Lamprigera yunnana]
MDETVDPCQDFYKFACGRFVKNTVIPDDTPIISSFTIIYEKVLQQLRTVLEELLHRDDDKPFGVLKKFYGACMNVTEIDGSGRNVTKNILKKLGGWPVLEGKSWKEENFDWKHSMYQFRKVGIPTNSLITLYPGTNIRNSSQYIIICDQAKLGLDREHLVKGFNEKIVKAYYNYLIDLATILGAQKVTAKKELKDSVMFEISLAKITLSNEQRRNYSTLTNVVSILGAKQQFPIIPWTEYIQNLTNDPNIVITELEEIDIRVPQFLIDLNKLLKRTPKRVVANYIMSQVLCRLVPYSTTQMRLKKLEFSKAFYGIVQMKPRWRECAEHANTALKVATGALYIRNYFDNESKISANTLVHYLRSEFFDILRKVSWMDNDTRREAENKLSKMVANVGYPSELMDNKKIRKHYKNLNFTSNTFVEMALNIYKFYEDGAYRQLRRKVNKTDWRRFSSAADVNAYYNQENNGIQLPAGILQEVFFDSKRPNYLNFGSMGFIIGHEITHGFDDMGRQYNEDGDLEDWWKNETAQAFLSHTQCIINQYSNYTCPDVNLKINGVNTQGETIADNGGVKEAYLAYRNWVLRNGVESLLPGLKYTTQQLFWIALANVFCSKGRPEYLTQEILTDVHPPSNIRLLGMISNCKRFGHDFNCKLGSPMNPCHKCRIW